MHTSMPSSVRMRTCVHGNVLVRTSLLHCLCMQSFPNYSPQWTAGGRGDSSWLSHQCLERQVAVETWRVQHRQHQATATKACIWASAISWLSCWTLVVFVSFGKLAGWSIHVYTTHPTLREVIMVKVVLKIGVHHVLVLWWKTAL